MIAPACLSVFLDQFSVLAAFCVLSVLILFGKLSVLLFIFLSFIECLYSLMRVDTNEGQGAFGFCR